MIVSVKNQEVYIDSSDISLFNSRVWHISDTGYVLWRGIVDGKKKTIRYHRLVAKAKDNEIVDHINRNKLDNRKANLRICTSKENVHNSDRYDRAKGYYYDKTKRRWAVDFSRYNARSIYVDSEKDAINYIESLKNNETPHRVFTQRKSLGGAKLSEADRKRIIKLFRSGEKRYIIAKEYKLSPSTIGRLVSGRTWQ